MTKNYNLNDDEIMKLLESSDRLNNAMQAGIKFALRKHKQAGNPVCIWRNNQIVWISPDEIPED